MDEQFKVGGLTVTLTKGEDSRINIEYSFGDETYTDKVEIGDMRKFVSRIKKHVDGLYENSSQDYAKYLDQKTAEKLKALGIKDLSYVTRGFRE